MLDSALEILRLQASGEASAVEIAEQAIQQIEAVAGCHQRVHSCRPRAGDCRCHRCRRAAESGPRDGTAGRGSRRRQRRALHQRHADDLLVQHASGFPSSLRRHRDRKTAKSGRGHRWKDEHGRVRDGGEYRKQRLWCHSKPLGHDAHPGRQQWRIGGLCCRRHRTAQLGNGHRWIDSTTGRAVRRDGTKTDLWSRQPLWVGRVCQQPGPSRPDCLERRRRRLAVTGDRWLRTA